MKSNSAQNVVYPGMKLNTGMKLRWTFYLKAGIMCLKFRTLFKEVRALELLQVIQQHLSLTLLFPAATLIFLIWFFLRYRKASRPLPGTSEWIDMEVSRTGLTFLLARRPMGKRDVLPMFVIFAAFLFLALFRLGDFVAPQRFFQFSDRGDQVLIEFEAPVEVSAVMYYAGLGTVTGEGGYILEFSEDGAAWHEQIKKPGNPSQNLPAYSMSHSHADMFKWRYAGLSAGNPSVRFIRLTASETPMELGELAIFGPGNRLIGVSRISSTDAPALFDEQDLVPKQPTYINGMYFDEVYHARTAFEFLRGVTVYETSHPPLGKAIIALSIQIFGMTPFGWRFAGAFFGALMLLVMYIFLKNMFGRTSVATCGTLLFGFEFMRFVQTRIATIDTCAVFFILLAYFFMYRHITTPPDSRFRDSLVSLALSGASFGLGCASKWNVIYAGLGLALIFTIRLIHLAKYYKTNGRPGFGAYLTKTLLFSALFFGAVPAMLYCLCYIPFAFCKGVVMSADRLLDPEMYREFFRVVWANQILMFSYHSGLESAHPYSSVWWQWLLNAQPIKYTDIYIGELRSSFSAFGNPVVWWGGLIAMLMMLVRVLRYHDGKALFILLGYLSQLLPWIPVTRIVFIYHYFPGTLFLVLALGHIFSVIRERKRKGHRLAVYGFTAATGLVFALFYPALSGLPVPHWYFEKLLRWIPVSWPL